MRWILLAALVCASPAALQAQKEEVCTPEFEKAVEMAVDSMIAKGLDVKFTQKEVYLDPQVWATLDAEAKKNLTHVLGAYRNCVWLPARVVDRKGRPVEKLDSFMVDLIDKRTGKTLSSIGIFRGYRVH